MKTHESLLSIGVWILWVGGVVCTIIGTAFFMMGKPVLDSAVHAFMGTASITLSAVVAWLRRKL